MIQKIVDDVLNPPLITPLDGNPHLDYFWRVHPEQRGALHLPWYQRPSPAGIYPHAARFAAVDAWSWAVPSDEALDVIARYGPVVEMGAGSGYWAALLAARGVDIVAYDKWPGASMTEATYSSEIRREVERLPAVLGQNDLPPLPPPRARGELFFPVRAGDPEALAAHGDRTLFLCWPPYSDLMARDALEQWRGQYLVYVGEHEMGCCAEAAFFRRLEANYEEVTMLAIPSWYGINDALWVYRRR